MESEFAFRTVMDGHDLPSIELDAAAQLVWCNTAFSELIHQRAEDLIGRGLLEFLPSSDGNRRSFAMLHHSLEKGRGLSLEMLCRRESGLDFQGQLELSPRGDGPAAGFILFVRDIHPEFQRRQSLLREAGYYRELLHSLPLAFCRTDLRGDVLEANPALLEILGFTESEVLANGREILTPEAWHDQDRQLLDHILAAKDIASVERELRHRDGTPLRVELFLGCARDSSGRPDELWYFLKPIESGHRRIVPRALPVVEALKELLSSEGKIVLCASCQSARLPQREWEPLDLLLGEQAGIEVAHTICETCVAEVMPSGRPSGH